jgi:hypothetical protein
MADVHKAQAIYEEGVSREVAIKRILPHLLTDPHFVSLFVKEASAYSSLSHPNIVTLLDFGKGEDGRYFLVLEFVSGGDLAHIAELARGRGKPLDPDLCAFVIAEVLRGLDHAHSLTSPDGKPAGIIHRDISPHNILVDRTGAVKINDYGISRSQLSTHTGSVVGKLYYMAPEQAQALPIDGRADLFSAGVMLYELLAGVRPFSGETDMETMAQLLVCRPVALRQRDPSLPQDLCNVAHRLMAQKPEDRFQSAGEAREALLACECYPTDGVTLLSRAVRILLDGELSRLVVPRRPRPKRAAAPRTLRLSRRALGVLGLAAAVSVLAAIVAWTRPARREPVARTAEGTAKPEIESAEQPVADRPQGMLVDPTPDAGLVAAGQPPDAGLVVAVSVDAAPAAVAEMGTLTIKVSPRSRITVNGEPWGQTSSVTRSLPPGKYKIVVENSELRKPCVKDVTISTGQHETFAKQWPIRTSGGSKTPPTESKPRPLPKEGVVRP